MRGVFVEGDHDAKKSCPNKIIMEKERDHYTHKNFSQFFLRYKFKKFFFHVSILL